jgi:hypothetical protein
MQIAVAHAELEILQHVCVRVHVTTRRVIADHALTSVIKQVEAVEHIKVLFVCQYERVLHQRLLNE